MLPTGDDVRRLAARLEAILTDSAAAMNAALADAGVPAPVRVHVVNADSLDAAVAYLHEWADVLDRTAPTP